MSEKYPDTEEQGAFVHEHDCIVASLRDRIAELEARLEMTHHYELAEDGVTMVRVEIPSEDRTFCADGIECRDATISLQNDRSKKQKDRIRELEAALAPFAKAEAHEDMDFDGETTLVEILSGDRVRLRDLRRARSTLSGTPLNRPEPR